MRRVCVIAAVAALIVLWPTIRPATAVASYGLGGSSVACQASSSATEFNGNCIGLETPTEPTQPALWHHWITSPPSQPVSCAPYNATEWAASSAAKGGGQVGGVWTVDGQRVPIVYSTPQTDWGWVYTVTCGGGGIVRFMRVVAEPRHPSPCSLQTATAACLPGLDPTTFLADVEGHVPAETIVATPPGLGVVGVP